MANDQKEASGNKLLYIFSLQLLDALRDSDAVVVQDVTGTVVSRVPGESGDDSWISSADIANRQQVARYPAADGDIHICYEIPLRANVSSKPFGRLIVRFTTDDAARHSADLDNAGAVIECIARHIAITTDLSSTQLTLGHNEADMRFIAGLDKLTTGRQPKPALTALLKGTARHLECTMAAVLAPQAGLKLFWPNDALENDQAKESIIRAVGKLYASAKESRKVIVSSDQELADLLKTSAGDGKQILCSPVADPQSRVNGVLILVRKAQFSRDDVRLARALCVKISGLLVTDDLSNDGPMDRRAIIDRIDSDIKRAPQVERAFLFVDIDRLHVINDRFGHAVGDEIIGSALKVLEGVARPRDAVASLSGDLMGLYLDAASEDQAIAMATKLLNEIANTPVSEARRSMNLSVSIGIALIPEHAATGSQAVNIAEVACQSAKSRGTGQYVLFRDHDASIMQRHADLSEIGNLQSALIENRFVIYAQKIQSLRDGEPARKFELLTRMLDSDGNLVPPQNFLSAAVRYQMMPALDRWVISHSLQQLAEAENMLEINLSGFGINVSGQSLADEGFSEFVVKSVLESGLSPDSICFEITESSAVKSIEQALQFINDVRSIGCTVALDDFGTGYCSFSYLQDIPVDFLKIDGMFVKNIDHNALSEAIVKAVVGIAKVMGAATIAEYVENAAIAKCLEELDVDFGQGFGIGRPEPLADILDRMDSPLDLGLSGTVRIADASDIRKLA
ncbi:MAG: putative bifunctional diguanylate cyclase/phosphodiesterase [Woeseiaceae bacterium]